MGRWRVAVVVASVSQLSLTLLVLCLAPAPPVEGWKGVLVLGLPGVLAVLALLTDAFRSAAVAVNGLAVLVCIPLLLIGIVEPFAPPPPPPSPPSMSSGSWLGGWLYLGIGIFAAGGVTNIYGVGHLTELRERSAEPGTAADPAS